MNLENVLNGSMAADAETNERIQKLRAFFRMRHWHEFGEELSEMLYSCRDFNEKPILEQTLTELSTNLDPFVLVGLLDILLSRFETDPTRVEAQLRAAEETLRKNEQALQFVRLVEAKTLLRANNFERGVKMLQDAERFFDSQRAVPKAVYALLSQLKVANFWKTRDYDAFYKSLLQYAAYEEPRKVLRSDRLELAERGLLGALVSDNVLSFGELLTHPFFAVLREAPEKAYVWTLAETFGSGKVADFELFLTGNAHKVQENAFLAANIDKLRKKIRTIALYDAVFFSNQHFAQSSLTFDQVCSITKIDKAQVEKLLVHVLSIGVLKGYISETSEQFFITGLKPQELDKSRLAQLRDKFVNWNGIIQNSIEFMNQC